MALPVVAIVGRPNVGKSSLLNALAGRRISIVDSTAGVTRDRVSALVELDGKFFELVDTGGFGIEDHDNLTKHVESQIKHAISQAQLVLFVIDVREGVTPLDVMVAQLLRPRNVPVLLVANKADSAKQEQTASEFCQLGFGEPLCVSALHGRNRGELVEQVLHHLEGLDTQKPSDILMTIACVGRRNVGKSTFINSLAGEERVIVSEIPGTTRDSVDVRFEMDGKSFIAIDTAGLRKKGKMTNDNIEFFSYTRSTQSIRRAEIVLFFIDATEPVGQVDKKLARYIVDQFKPCIIVVNKWDLVKDQADSASYRTYLDRVLPGLSYAPISFITASEGKNVRSLIHLARELHKQVNANVRTTELNNAIQAITQDRTPSAKRGSGLPRMYYGTQVATQPPTLLLFVNNPDAFDDNYQRYLLNRLRQLLPFSEVPVRLLFRHHHRSRREARE